MPEDLPQKHTAYLFVGPSWLAKLAELATLLHLLKRVASEGQIWKELAGAKVSVQHALLSLVTQKSVPQIHKGASFRPCYRVSKSDRYLVATCNPSSATFRRALSSFVNTLQGLDCSGRAES